MFKFKSAILFGDRWGRKHICELSKDNIRKISENYKVAYVHNILSRQDYINDLSCDYDFSVGGLINRDFKMNVEMKYSSSRIDKIRNYFDKQQFQMIDFVYKFKQKTGRIFHYHFLRQLKFLLQMIIIIGSIL